MQTSSLLTITHPKFPTYISTCTPVFHPSLYKRFEQNERQFDIRFYNENYHQTTMSEKQTANKMCHIHKKKKKKTSKTNLT